MGSDTPARVGRFQRLMQVVMPPREGCHLLEAPQVCDARHFPSIPPQTFQSLIPVLHVSPCSLQSPGHPSTIISGPSINTSAHRPEV